MNSNLELHNVVKSCVNRRDYLRIYSNKVLPEGTQKVKFYGISDKEPNKKVIAKYLEACGFTSVSVLVRHSGSQGRLIRSLVIYAKPGARLVQSKVPPYFFSSPVVAPPVKTLKRATPEEAFNAQRSLTKKEVMKLKPGTWLEVKWLDDWNTVVLLLERPESGPGDVSLRCYDPSSNGYRVHSHVVHSQVVRVIGTVEVPVL